MVKILKQCYIVDLRRGAIPAMAHILAESCRDKSQPCPLLGLNCPISKLCDKVNSSDWKRHLHKILLKSLGEHT